jgi:hypothetical protein
LHRSRIQIALVILASLCESCATTKVVATNAQRVYNGQPVDQQAISQAIASDTKDIGAELQVMRKKFAEALTLLKSNVQKRWGEKDTKVADRTMYVKYTQGYKSRVVTDFDHGTFTVETVDEQNARASLKAALISALLTSNDPAAVDLFTDKDVDIDYQAKALPIRARARQPRKIHTHARTGRRLRRILGRQQNPIAAAEVRSRRKDYAVRHAHHGEEL